jgi:hypothetical protein
MMNVLGLPISKIQLKTWLSLLTSHHAPFFLTDELKPRVLSLHLTRNEFRATIQDVSFHDSYTTYAVGSEATWVTLLSDNDLKSLPDDVKSELLQLQTQLRRGQIYNFSDYKGLLKDDELEQARPYIFEFEEKQRLELNHTLWHSFSFETQKRWLTTLISEDRSDCLSGTLSKRQWQSINKHYPAIKHLVGFADRSGPNCFATTLAVRLEVEQAKDVLNLWLQTETFLRTLQELGYRRTTLSPNENLAQGSILILGDDKSIQHACFYLGDSLVFNKDAQTWFAPRQILRLETVIQNWQEFEVNVYTN